MFCIACGNPTVPEAAFCAHCGRPVAADVTQPAPAPSPSPAVARPAPVAPPRSRGWYHRDGDPEGVQRWHTGTAWTDSTTGRGASAGVPRVTGSARSTGSFGQRLDAFQSHPNARSTGYVPAPRRASGRVIAASVLLYVTGGFDLLAGVFLLALARFAAWVGLVAVIVLAVGGTLIWAGVGVARLQRAARTTAIALAAIGALLGLFALFRGNPLSIIGLGLDIAIIILLSGDETDGQFR